MNANMDKMKYNEEYIVNNRLKNLIGVVNLDLENKSGIRAALSYRIGGKDNKYDEVDSSDIVKKAYRIVYGENIPESADTILNAFTLFDDFCTGKLMKLQYHKKLPDVQKNISEIRMNKKVFYQLIDNHLDDIFNGNRDLKILFDVFFDHMYSFSNMMPVPKGFNSSSGLPGNGDWNLNKDYPSVYYQNLVNGDIDNGEKMKPFLDEKMDLWGLKEIYELEPPYSIEEYYGYKNDDRKKAVCIFIEKACRLIEERSNKLGELKAKKE